MKCIPAALQRQMGLWPIVTNPDDTRIQNICRMCCITAVWIVSSVNTNINTQTDTWIWRRAAWYKSTTFGRNLYARLHDATFQKIVIIHMYGFAQFWHKLNLAKEFNSGQEANVLTSASIVYLNLNIFQHQFVLIGWADWWLWDRTYTKVVH